MEKVLDPWYQATHLKPSDISYIGATNGTSTGSSKFYLQDQPGSPLACTEKWQWCLPLASGGRYCTRLGPLNDVYEDAFTNAAGPSTSELMDWIFSQLEITHSAAPSIMGVQALLSRKKLDEGWQGSLPDNQWQMDVEHWFQISIAAYQKIFVDIAAGPLSSMPEDFVKRPANDVQTNLCNNQVFAYTPFLSQHLRPDTNLNIESYKYRSYIIQCIWASFRFAWWAFDHCHGYSNRAHRWLRTKTDQS